MSSETATPDELIEIADQRLRGFFIVDNDVFSNRRAVSAYGLIVYFVICRLARCKDDAAVASRGYIAKMARISTGSVTKAVTELQASGLVTVEQRRNGSRKLPSRYTLNPVVRRSGGDGQVVTVTTEPISTYALESKDALKRNAAKKASPSQEAFVLPSWVDAAAWAGFAEMRDRLRKPMTEKAKLLMVKKLNRMHDAGQDVTAVLEQSTMNGWTDVYAVKGESNGIGANGRNGASKFEQNADNLRAAIARRRGADGGTGGDGVLPGNGSTPGLPGVVLPPTRPRIPARSVGGAEEAGRDGTPRVRNAVA